jgi:hypothetical protein
MTKLNRLKREALEACVFRGHDMGRFNNWCKTAAVSYCKICDKQVVVNTHPMANEIDIGGAAVALSCED